MVDRGLTAVRSNPLLVIEFFLALGAIVFLFFYDRPPKPLYLSEKRIQGIGIIVAAWVGLLTLHTLRHAIRLSVNEPERDRDVWRPVLIAECVDPDQNDTNLVTVRFFSIKITNVGAGTSLDGRVEIPRGTFNMEFDREFNEPFLLVPGDSRRILCTLDELNPFRQTSGDGFFPTPGVVAACTRKINGEIRQAEYDEIHDVAWRAHRKFVREKIGTYGRAGNFLITYKDIFGRPMTTIFSVEIEATNPNSYPLVEVVALKVSEPVPLIRAHSSR